MATQGGRLHTSRFQTLSRFYAVAMCLIPASFAPALARAQDPLQDETLLFQDVARVSAASRYEQDTRDAPASITIITAEDIRRYGYRSLADVLANVRGFMINDDRNYSYVGVRGFAVPGDYNSRVLFLVDGHPINDGVFESALIAQGALIDLRVVDRIEIVRGPSSSVYGTDALFGVVNIVTLRGRALQGVELASSSASWDSYRAALTGGWRAAGGPELLVASSLYRSRGQDLYFPEFDAPATNQGRAIGVDGDRYDRQFAKLGWRDWTLQAGRSWRQKHIPTGSFQTLFNDPRTVTVDAHRFAFLRHEHGFADASRLEATLGYDAYDYRGRYAYADGLFADYGIARWWSFAGHYVRPVGAHRLVAGADARWSTRLDQGGDNVDSGTVVFRSHRGQELWAVFAQDEWRVARGLLLSLGVRYDHYETIGGTTNPRAAIVYQAGRIGTVKALYGRAFRAPNAYELDYEDGGLSSKAALALRPEIMRSSELVFESAPLPGLRVTATAFSLRLHDLVTQVVDPADSLLVFENRGGTRSEGFEVEADVRLAGGLMVGASYTRQDVDDPTSGAEAANAPYDLLKTHLSAPMLDDRFRASVVTRHTGSQRTVNGVTVRRSTVADLTVVGRPSDHVSLTGSVYNLFDASYAQPAGGEQVIAVVPQSRRTVRLTVQVLF